MDTLSADAFFARASTLDALERYREARASYVAAKDRDQLRFRASEDMNEIIREEAAAAAAIVVDSRGALSTVAADGIIGSDLMLEHLHPNIEGYFVIADAFYEALRQHDFVGEWDLVVPRGRARNELLVTAVDSLFGEYRLLQLMGQWPFQPPGVVLNEDARLQARDSIDQIALDLHRRKISWYDATESLRRYYKRRGDYHHALKAALAAVQQYPFLPAPYAEAGDILMRQGRLQEALDYFEAATTREESATVYFMMGSIYFAQRQFDSAESSLRKAIELQPRYPQALYQLARVYAARERWDDARQVAERLLDLTPGNPEIERFLTLLSRRGQSEAQ